MKSTLKSLFVGTALGLAGLLNSAAATPSFSLAWSEYPSWSVFGVADAFKLIDGKEGKLGPIEQKWGVDIVLKEAEYDPCLTMYGAGQADAVCITGMDVLNPSLSRPSVMVLPTSTSFGADALIVDASIKSVKDLKGKKVFGLAKSVSEYTFARNLELLGEKEKDYVFANMDPGAAAVAMQQKQKGVEAILVWNPFVMETLNKRKDVRVLFDSTKIPNEIIDSVCIAETSLAKPGGKEFAAAIIDVFYAVNQRMAAPATRKDTLVALGEKFSHLDATAMETVVKQTKFYSTPDEGLAVLNGKELPEIMKKVVEFCVAHEITGSAPKLAYGKTGAGANLRFDPTYIEMAKAKK